MTIDGSLDSYIQHLNELAAPELREHAIKAERNGHAWLAQLIWQVLQSKQSPEVAAA